MEKKNGKRDKRFPDAQLQIVTARNFYALSLSSHHPRVSAAATMKTAALSRSAAPTAPAGRAARRARGIVAVRSSNARAAASSDDGASPTTTTTSSVSLSRRSVLLASAAATAAAASAASLTALPSPASAQIAQRNTFTVDLLPKFQLDVPSTWTTTDAEVPGAVSNRPTRVWFPRDEPRAPSDVNVSLVVSMVGADFTSLGSFGDAETFGESLVAMMDRGFAGGPSARLLSARSVSRQASPRDGEENSSNSKPQKVYKIEYAVRRDGEEGERVFVSAVALSFDGVYNRLYTVTGQVAAGEAAEKHGKEVAAIVKSFVPPATRV